MSLLFQPAWPFSISMLSISAQEVRIFYLIILNLEQQKMISQYVNKGKEQAVNQGVNYAVNNPGAFM